MKGRKALPDHLKIVKGTLRKHRVNEDQPAPAEELPNPPEWLEPSEVECFVTIRDRLEELGIASKTDTEVLLLAAVRLAEVRECSALIREQGRDLEIRDDDGTVTSRRINPVVKQRNEAMRHLHSLLSELGLSPASRSKVKAPKKTEATPAPFTVRGAS